jgi:hypothetical protein
MEIKAKEITLFPSVKLSEYPKNVNVHTEEQIDKIIQLIDFYGHRDPLIVDADIQPDGTHWVMAGNGRLQASKKAGWGNIPIIFQKFNSEEEKYGFMVSHNAVSSSGWGGGLDLAKINTDITDLGPDFDIDLLGIKDFTIEPVEKFELEDDEEAVDLSEGTKKAIMIEFNPEHYDEAYELVKFWRNQEAYVGMMILTFLKQKKDEIN